MGEIKKVLAERKLPERELHNSRLFVDLSEQVHIHFREIRNQFSVDEFFEYADVIARSVKDLKRHLLWHPEYEEQVCFDNILVAIGPEQQTRPLQKSPAPHCSTYFPDRLQIELQAEKVIDEIHIHYRDYRLAMNQETFRVLADAMTDAKESLDEFLGANLYVRETHPFRKAIVEDKYFESKRWLKFSSNKIDFVDYLKKLKASLRGGFPPFR